MARPDANHPEDLNEDLPPREVTLSTSAILGLFFALALVCAAFFGFGYSVGRKSTAASTDVNPNAPVTDTYKPPAGSPAIQAVPGYLTAQQATDANRSGNDAQVLAPPSASTPVGPTAKPVSAAQAASNNSAARINELAAPAAAAARAQPTPTTAVAEPPAAATPPAPVAASAQSAATGNAYNYVQIAAVSREDDADLLIKALRSRGYTVAAHPEADHLVHVQMGPFTTRKDAEAMRQRLLSDGYNAIVK